MIAMAGIDDLFLSLQRKKVVDTGIRRHDGDSAAAMRQCLRWLI
jgi:hypothetical protein